MLRQTIQFFLLSLFFASALAMPKGDNGGRKGNSTTKATSLNAQCFQMEKLTKLVAIANNDTMLASLSSTKAQKLKDQATQAQTTLSQLESNTTLTEACPAVLAARQLKTQCKVMATLQKAQDMANNDTLLNEIASKRNTTVEKLKAKAAAATTKLQDLMSNQTLVSSCQTLSAKGASTGSASDSTSDSSSAEGASQGASAGTASFAIKTAAQSPIAVLSAMIALGAFMGIL